MNKFKIILILIIFTVKIYSYDTIAVRTIGSGVVYYHIKTEEPNNIYILQADLKENNNIKLAIANERIGNTGATVNEMSKALSKNTFVLAGVNADFFGGSPYQFENSMIMDGQFVKAVNIGRSLIAFTEQKNIIIDTIKFNGYIKVGNSELKINSINSDNLTDKVKLYNRFYNLKTKIDDNKVGLLIKSIDKLKLNIKQKFVVNSIFNKNIPKFLFSDRYLAILPKEVIKLNNVTINDTVEIFLSTIPIVENINQMIGGLPKILNKGEVINNFAYIEGINNEGFFGKNPRTAIGFNKEQNKLYIVAIDGRDKNNSVGFTLPELSKFMKELGCYDALNFDGGGSTTMVIRDSTVNKPSDYTGERKVNNALFLSINYLSPEFIRNINVYSDKHILNLNEKTQINISCTDIWGFTGNFPINLINFEFDNETFKITDNQLIAKKEGKHIIKWSFGQLNGKLLFEVK